MLLVSISGPIFLTVGLPALLLGLFNTSKYVGLTCQLFELKDRQLKRMTNFVEFCSFRSQELLKLRKFDDLLKRFHELNRVSLLLSAN